MKTTCIIAVTVLIVASGFALRVAPAQQPGIKRTDLQRHDLSAPGREAVQVRVEFAPEFRFRSTLIRAKKLSMSSKVFGVSGRGQAAGNAQGRSGLVHPGRSVPHGEERRQWHRSGAGHVYRRKRQAASRAGQVRAR